MPKFDEFWKKATDVQYECEIHGTAESAARIQSEDDAKRVAGIFNRAGEITKQAGITWDIITTAMSSRPSQKMACRIFQSPFEAHQGPSIEELFLKNTDPDKVVFELDVYWAMMAQQDPVEWINKYSQRYKLLHIKDRWIIGDSGMLNFANIFKAGYKNGMTNYFCRVGR